MLDNIFEQLMYTTLRIECIDSIGNIFSIGTGFLIQRPVGDNKYKLYLVSNKHVLCNTDSIAISKPDFFVKYYCRTHLSVLDGELPWKQIGNNHQYRPYLKP